jgi:hypothetical protein
VKNPFKVGEKVITKVGGKDAEAVVTKLWQNEVQVRTPDNELRWRTVYTVWYPGASPMKRQGSEAANSSKPSTTAPAKKTGRAKTKQASGKRSRKRH